MKTSELKKLYLSHKGACCDDGSDEDETAETKEMIYHACYGDEKITSIIVSSYCYCPGEIAIELNSRDESDGTEEPFATLTACLGEGERFNEPGFAYVDTNNMPGAEQFIKENGLGEPTGVRLRSGFCTYPLYKFNIDELKKYVKPEYMDEFENYLKQFRREEDT